MKAATIGAMNEWLTELEQLHRTKPEGVTSYEIGRATGKSQCWATMYIRRGIEAGTIRFAGRRSTVDVTGRSAKVPVYALVKKK